VVEELESVNESRVTEKRLCGLLEDDQEFFVELISKTIVDRQAAAGR
jgi:hypothetical protein